MQMTGYNSTSTDCVAAEKQCGFDISAALAECLVSCAVDTSSAALYCLSAAAHERAPASISHAQSFHASYVLADVA